MWRDGTIAERWQHKGTECFILRSGKEQFMYTIGPADAEKVRKLTEAARLSKSEAADLDNLIDRPVRFRPGLAGAVADVAPPVAPQSGKFHAKEFQLV